MCAQIHGGSELPTLPPAACEIQRVPIRSLLLGDSPRINGEDDQHIDLLAQMDTLLPPILVQRGTMRVIDGMHRLRAAILLGHESIEVRFFDGTEAEAFIAAVKVNTEHGLPLTLADREAAASRIIALYPQHSDRWIAGVTGLAPGTVAAVRRRAEGGHSQPTRGTGRAGGVRRVNSKPAKRPPGSGGDRENRNAVASAPQVRDRGPLLCKLQKDPSLRFNEAGRRLLRWLDTQAADPGELDLLADVIPSHCLFLIAELARCCAKEWLVIARRRQHRVDAMHFPTPPGVSAAIGVIAPAACRSAVPASSSSRQAVGSCLWLLPVLRVLFNWPIKTVDSGTIRTLSGAAVSLEDCSVMSSKCG